MSMVSTNLVVAEAQEGRGLGAMASQLSATQLVRVAVIGCGRISQELHLPILAGHERIRLAALVDRDLQRAQDLAKGYGVARVVTDAAELDQEEIDAAVVATPPFHHAPCAIALMRRGIHVLVEKPMATSYADAAAMVQAAEESGVMLAVGFFRRLMPSMRMLKALVDSAWLGRPMGFQVEGGGLYDWPAATLGNMRKDWAGGGVLIDFGSHMLDLLHYLFEGPAEVLEYRDNALGGIEADCSMRLQFSHGGRAITGTVELARTRKVGNLIRIACERGTMEYQISQRYQIRITPYDLQLTDPLQGRPCACSLQANWVDEPETPWYETVRAEIDDWLHAIHTGHEAQLSGRSALPTVKLIDDCYCQRLPLAEPWVDAAWSDERVALSEQKLSSLGATLNAQRSTPRRVLVTGASGFIGCRVAEILALRDGWQVRALVHNPANAARLARLPVEMVQADLGSNSEVERLVQGCDAIVHCAIGTAWGQRREIFSVTVDGTRRLASAALAAQIGRFVHLSTMAVYGDDSKLTGMLDESIPPSPFKGSDYGESKLEAERVVAQAVNKGLSALILRPSRVYGPYSRIFIVRPIEAIAEGRFRWLGSPDVPADMVYVDNLVEAIVRSLEGPDDAIKGEVFNIGDGDDITWRAFYEYFANGLEMKLDAPLWSPESPATTQRGLLAWPASWLRGMKSVVTSPEFRALGRTVLQTDPLGQLPRWALNRFPGIERTIRRLVKADGSLPLYRRTQHRPRDIVEMGSGGALVSIDKARRVLGYCPPVPRARALELTLEWIKHARLV
jgi:predicted dehydrogenase/nucleoside-diphosphate-sugar epimerase